MIKTFLFKLHRPSVLVIKLIGCHYIAVKISLPTWGKISFQFLLAYQKACSCISSSRIVLYVSRGVQ